MEDACRPRFGERRGASVASQQPRSQLHVLTTTETLPGPPWDGGGAEVPTPLNVAWFPRWAASTTEGFLRAASPPQPAQQAGVAEGLVICDKRHLHCLYH